jgi:ATP-dependent protease HslVU (ClpYQ) peptidase subunit
MAQKTEKLSQEILDKIFAAQVKLNEFVVNLGQLHLRKRDLDSEIQKVEFLKVEAEASFDGATADFQTILADLEKIYPKGEIDLNEGVVIYESAE